MTACVHANSIVLRVVVQADATVVLVLSSFEKCSPPRDELAALEVIEMSQHVSDVRCISG